MDKKSLIKFSGLFGSIFLIFGLIALLYFQQSTLAILAYIEIALGLAGIGFYLFHFFGETTKSLYRQREAFYGVVGAILILFILIGINVVAHSQFGERKFDLTTQKIHSLSEASVNALERLPHSIEIYSFLVDPRSRKLLTNLIEKYQYKSDKLDFKLTDPDRDPTLLEALGASVGEIVFLNPKTEKTIKLDRNQINEAGITTALTRIVSTEEQKIYFLQGNGEPELSSETQTGMYLANFLLEREGYIVEAFNLAELSEIPEDADLVIGWGATSQISQTQLEVMRAYLDEGGTMMIGQNAIVAPTRDRFVESGYESILKDFALRFDPSILLQSFQFGSRTIQVASVQSNEFSQHPMMQAMQNSVVQFSSAQPVLQTEAESEKLTRNKLLSSPNNVYAATNLKALLQRDASQRQIDFSADGPFPLAQIAERQISEGKKARLVVFGDANFALNELIQTAANADLFLNTIAYLVGRPEAVRIREKGWQNSTLEISDDAKLLVSFASLFAIPQLILILGFGIWMFRRSRR